MMNTNISFYASLHDYAFTQPYAVLSLGELTAMLEHFDRWVSTIATHPGLVDLFGDSVSAHIRLVTTLRTAVEASKQAALFPNIILARGEYEAAMGLLAITRSPRGVPALQQ